MKTEKLTENRGTYEADLEQENAELRRKKPPEKPTAEHKS